MDDILQLLTKVWEFVKALAMEHGPSVLLALFVLIVGLRIIKMLVGLSDKAMKRSNVEETLRKFAGSMTSWVLRILLFVSVAGMLGIQTTSFVAILGAAGLAIGLALQGTLANFAGGVLLLVFKPYKVGDLIEAQGQLGVVKAIQIFTTTMLSPENKTIIVPNGAISNGHITNYTEAGKIRVDTSIGIAYDADIKKAKQVLTDMLKADSRVLQDPAPMVAVSELADSAIVLAVRPWCDPAVYWDVYFDTLENGKYALDAANVTIPFPQVDVHMIPNE